MRRDRIVENEKRRSWSIGGACLQGKWKDYSVGKSRKCSRKKENSQSKKGGYRRQ